MRYIFYSVIVTLIDTAVVWSLYHIFSADLIIANTTGVVTGFIIHYLLASKAVFRTDLGIPGFIIYLGTFFIGLLLADWLIYAGENYLFAGLQENIRFLSSKGISILIPFFFLYFLRKFLFDLIRTKQHLIKRKI